MDFEAIRRSYHELRENTTRPVAQGNCHSLAGSLRWFFPLSRPKDCQTLRKRASVLSLVAQALLLNWAAMKIFLLLGKEKMILRAFTVNSLDKVLTEGFIV